MDRMHEFSKGRKTPYCDNFRQPLWVQNLCTSRTIQFGKTCHYCLCLRELEQMKRDSDQLKREVLAVAVAARNVTPAEVDDWLLRLPTIDVPLPARPGGTAGTSDKTTSLPLPRGTGLSI